MYNFDEAHEQQQFFTQIKCNFDKHFKKKKKNACKLTNTLLITLELALKVNLDEVVG